MSVSAEEQTARPSRAQAAGKIKGLDILASEVRVHVCMYARLCV